MRVNLPNEGRPLVTTRTPTDLDGAPAASTTAARVVERVAEAGVTLAIYLPDSVLTDVTRTLEQDPRIPTIVCTREDEGAAIAAGAALGGGLPIVLMEGSGVGYCGLILARAQVQRSAFLVIASHSPALGERHDYHAASRVVGAAVFGGLGIPYVVPRSADELVDVVGEALVTVRGQRAVVGILVPPSVLQ
ncbi:MAG TPA: thiamine pyrophosphate-binding protein [Candidatus Limnocylindrales bacterium]|nr:thiamine pyrophosphate-binding protein [Candidatus Limnocylindrales bacterium]